jgi:hypothetical protein
MAVAQLGFASPTLGFSQVNTDESVVTDGAPNPGAVVSVLDGTTRLDVDGNGIINANPIPALADVLVTREPGWQGSTGWRVELIDWAEPPNAIAIAVYNNPDGNDYSWTTGGFILQNDIWTVHCSPGFEPPDGTDFYLGFLYGSLLYYSFTYRDSFGESQGFSGGGDYAGGGGPPPSETPVVWFAKPAPDYWDNGSLVTHLGTTWLSTIDNNHWTPGTPGTEALWVDQG